MISNVTSAQYSAAGRFDGAAEYRGRDSANNSGGVGKEDRYIEVTLTGVPKDGYSPYSRNQVLQNAHDRERLTEAEKEQVRELEKRDSEVRQHEQAHVSMLGAYALSAPSYVYQVGPDGKAYAVGGSVDVSVGEESTPEATRMKAQRLRMAATGVSDPSMADLSVAARAGRMMVQA